MQTQLTTSFNFVFTFETLRITDILIPNINVSLNQNQDNNWKIYVNK